MHVHARVHADRHTQHKKIIECSHIYTVTPSYIMLHHLKSTTTVYGQELCSKQINELPNITQLFCERAKF